MLCVGYIYFFPHTLRYSASTSVLFQNTVREMQPPVSLQRPPQMERDIREEAAYAQNQTPGSPPPPHTGSANTTGTYENHTGSRSECISANTQVNKFVAVYLSSMSLLLTPHTTALCCLRGPLSCSYLKIFHISLWLGHTLNCALKDEKMRGNSSSAQKMCLKQAEPICRYIFREISQCAPVPAFWMIWIKSNLEQMLSHNMLKCLDIYKYRYVQELLKCLIFCKLPYVTSTPPRISQVPWRYGRARSTRASHPNGISAPRIRPWLRLGTDSCRPALWQNTEPFSGTTSAPARGERDRSPKRAAGNARSAERKERRANSSLRRQHPSAGTAAQIAGDSEHRSLPGGGGERGKQNHVLRALWEKRTAPRPERPARLRAALGGCPGPGNGNAERRSLLTPDGLCRENLHKFPAEKSGGYLRPPQKEKKKHTE